MRRGKKISSRSNGDSFSGIVTLLRMVEHSLHIIRKGNSLMRTIGNLLSNQIAKSKVAAFRDESVSCHSFDAVFLTLELGLVLARRILRLSSKVTTVTNKTASTTFEAGPKYCLTR